MVYVKNSNLLKGFNKEDIKSSKRVAHNTIKVILKDGTIVYKFYNTRIITINNNDKTVLVKNDGFYTKTTKERINEFIPFPQYLYQEDHIWYWSDGEEFYDGMVFDLDGNLLSEDKTIDKKQWNKAKRLINEFCKKIDNLEEIPMPESGDCWYCMLKTDDGKSMGDKFGSNEHLINHIKEGYLHGSLLVNAMKHVGYRNEQISIHYYMNYRDTFKRALSRYLTDKLLNRENYKKLNWNKRDGVKTKEIEEKTLINNS